MLISVSAKNYIKGRGFQFTLIKTVFKLDNTKSSLKFITYWMICAKVKSAIRDHSNSCWHYYCLLKKMKKFSSPFVVLQCLILCL